MSQGSARGIFTIRGPLPFWNREPKLKLQPLSKGLWTATDGVYRTIFAEGRHGVAAFDTFGTPGAARAYNKLITRTVPGKPIRAIIYSHDHLDHAGRAVDLAPAAEIVADEMAARVIALREAEGQLLPKRLVRGKRNEVEFAGAAFELINPGPTHGTGNLAAYFPDRKILFMSDTVLSNARYGMLPDYHIANFVRFMRELLGLEFETFVPGRYELMDRAQFARGCDYIEALQETTQRAFVEGVPIWVYDVMRDYAKRRLQDKFGDLGGFDKHVGLTAFRIVHHYLMGGWGLEDTPQAGYHLA